MSGNEIVIITIAVEDGVLTNCVVCHTTVEDRDFVL